MPMPETDVHERIADGVLAVINGLGLTEFTTSSPRPLSVYKQTLPDERTINFPCVLVTFEGGSEEEGEYDFEDQDVIYPINVTLNDRNPSEDQSWRAPFLRHRKAIADTFRPMTMLTGVEEVYDIRVRPLPVFDPKLPHYQYVVSGLQIRAYTREAREHR